MAAFGTFLNRTRVQKRNVSNGQLSSLQECRVVTDWAKSNVGRGHFRICRKAILEATIMHASINGAGITNGVKAHFGIVLGHSTWLSES